MTSISFNNGEKIQMEEKTQFRGNREIYKASSNIIIPLEGAVTIFEGIKEACTISYKLNKENELLWHQLNPPDNLYVVQIKINKNADTIMVKKIAIQKIIGEKNILLNI